MRLRSVAAALLCVAGFALAVPAAVQAQKTTITGSNLKMGGIPIPAGTVTITPTNGQNFAVGIGSADGDLGGPQGYACAILAGSITGTCQVPDQSTARTTVPNTALYYRVDVYNSAAKSVSNPYGGFTSTYLGVQGVTGASWALNTYAPPQNLVLSPTGAFVWRGIYSAANSYAVGNAVSYGRNTYLAVQAQSPQVPHAPDSSPAYWNLFVPGGTNGSNGIASLPQLAQTRVRLPIGANLFDPAAATPGGFIQADGSISANGLISTSACIPVNSGGPMIANVALGFGSSYLVYFDASGNVQPGYSTQIASGTTFTAPADSACLKFSYYTSGGPTIMVQNGTTLGPFRAFQLAAMSDLTEGNVSSLAGKKIAFWGDSITQIYGITWQTSLLERTGMVKVFQDARAGRNLAQTFEDYGNSPTGTHAASMTDCSATQPTSNWNTGGTVGNTLAQDLAAAAPDVLVFFLGTNDQARGTGATSDTVTTANPCTPPAQDANSNYGYAQWALNALHQARPQMMIVVVTPYQNGFGTLPQVQAVASVLRYSAGLLAMPIADLLLNSGIGYSTETDSAKTYTLDKTHPTAAGGLRIAAVIRGAITSSN